MVKKVIAFMLVMIILLPLAGCWGRRELSEIGIAVATGIDINDAGDIQLTVLSITPVSTGGKTSPERSITWVGVSEGPDISSAFNNIDRIATKEIVWLHNQLIVVGEKLARRGLKDIMEFIIRDREFRDDNIVLVTDRVVKDMLLIPADIEQNLSSELQGIIKNVRKQWPRACIADLREFLVSLSQNNRGIAVGKLGYNETDRNTFSTYRELYKRLYPAYGKLGIAYVEGSAVFSGYKFAGWIDGYESRGYNWVMGKVNQGSVSIENTHRKRTPAMTITSSKRNISAVIDNGKISIHLKIDVKGYMMQLGEDLNFDKQEDTQRAESMFSEAIKNEMQSIVNKAQKEYKTDIFGFGEYVARKYPNIWRKVENRWNNLFTDIDVRYDVKVKIKRMGMLSRPL